MSPKGGRRKGAGRKPLPDKFRREPVQIRLPRYLIDWLESRKDGSLGRMIEKAICYYKDSQSNGLKD